MSEKSVTNTPVPNTSGKNSTVDETMAEVSTVGTGTIATIGGDLTYLWYDRTGQPVVIASGWSDTDQLLQLIHPSLRPTSVSERAHPLIDDAVRRWADGDLDALDTVAVEQRSGPFTGQAWEVLRTVRGTISYTEFATRAGNPAAVRAAAAACAKNAAALFVPCHRILRNDGSLGGYRYGLAIKRLLIEHERA